jgi:hypothetical protein
VEGKADPPAKERKAGPRKPRAIICSRWHRRPLDRGRRCPRRRPAAPASASMSTRTR